MSSTVVSEGCRGNVRIVSSEIDQLKTNEFHRRRKLRLLQVREQSKDIAKRIRERAQRESHLQVSSIERLKGKQFSEKRGKLIGHLDSLYQDAVNSLGDGHEKAREINQKGEEETKNTDLSRARGKVAACQLKKSRQAELDKKKEILYRKVLARKQANERARKKISQTSLTCQNAKLSDEATNEPAGEPVQHVSTGVPDKFPESVPRDTEALQKDPEKKVMETQFSIPARPEEAFLASNKNTPHTTQNLEPCASKPRDLFALSDDMPSSLRGTAPNDDKACNSASKMSLISEFVQSRNNRLPTKQSFKKTNNLDLEGIKETIARSKLCTHVPGGVSGRQTVVSNPFKTPTESSEGKKDTVLHYNHASRAIRDLPLQEELVTKEQGDDLDAYSLANKESQDQISAGGSKNDHQEKRGKIAMRKEKVAKEYEETMAFLNKMTKEHPARPIRSAYMADQRIEEQALKRQRHMQEDFERAQREDRIEQRKQQMREKLCNKKKPCRYQVQTSKDQVNVIEHPQSAPNQKVISIKTSDVTSGSDEPTVAECVEMAHCLLRMSKQVPDKEAIRDKEGLRRARDALENIRKRPQQSRNCGDGNKDKEHVNGKHLDHSDSVDAVPCKDTDRISPREDDNLSTISRSRQNRRALHVRRNIDKFIDEILNVDCINYTTGHDYGQRQWSSDETHQRRQSKHDNRRPANVDKEKCSNDHMDRRSPRNIGGNTSSHTNRDVGRRSPSNTSRNSMNHQDERQDRCSSRSSSEEGTSHNNGDHKNTCSPKNTSRHKASSNKKDSKDRDSSRNTSMDRSIHDKSSSVHCDKERSVKNQSDHNKKNLDKDSSGINSSETSQSFSNGSDIHGISDGKKLILYKVIDSKRSKESVSVVKSLTSVDKELRKLLGDAGSTNSKTTPERSKRARIPFEPKNQGPSDAHEFITSEPLEPMMSFANPLNEDMWVDWTSKMTWWIHESPSHQAPSPCDGSDKENTNTTTKKRSHDPKSAKKILQWDVDFNDETTNAKNSRPTAKSSQIRNTDSITSLASSFKTTKTSPKPNEAELSEHGKILLGAANFIDDNVYEVVIQLKRKNEDKQKEVNATKDSEQQAEKEKLLVEKGVNTVKHADSSTATPPSDNCEDKSSKPIHSTIPGEFNDQQQTTTSTETTSHDENIEKQNSEHELRRKMNNHDGILTALYNMPTTRHAAMSSSTSTAYTSPPEMLLPKYLSTHNFVNKPVSRKISFESAEVKSTNNQTNLKPKKKCKKHKSYRRVEAKLSSNSNNGSKNENVTVLMSVIEKLIGELSKKAINSESKECELKKSQMSSRLQTYIHKLLLVNRDELAKMDKSPLQCSPVTTPGSSVVNQPSNITTNSSKVQINQLLLDYLKKEQYKEFECLPSNSEDCMKNIPELIAKRSRKTIPVYRTKMKSASKNTSANKASCQKQTNPKRQITNPYKTIPSLKVSSGFVRPIRAAEPITVPRESELQKKGIRFSSKTHSIPFLKPKASLSAPSVKTVYKEVGVNKPSSKSQTDLNLNKKETLNKRTSYHCEGQVSRPPSHHKEELLYISNYNEDDRLDKVSSRRANEGLVKVQSCGEGEKVAKVSSNREDEKLAKAPSCREGGKPSNATRSRADNNVATVSSSHKDNKAETHKIGGVNEETCNQIVNYIKTCCAKVSKETLTDNKVVSKQTQKNEAMHSPLKRAEEQIEKIHKYAESTEKSTKRLSDLAKILTEVQKNKPEIYNLASNPTSSDTDTFKTTDEVKTIYTKANNNKNVRTEDCEFTPMFSDIPKPITMLCQKEQMNLPHYQPIDRDKKPVYKQPKVRPPTALSRISLKNVSDIQTPHELSTVIEMDTPVSIKKKSFKKEKQLTKDSEKSSCAENKPALARKLDLNASKPTDPTIIENLVKCMDSSPDSDWMLKNKAIINSLNGKSGGKIEMIEIDKFNEIMLKPFLTLDEFAKKHNISASDLSNMEEPLRKLQKESHDLSDSTIPDIVAELIKLKLISEPFSYDSVSNDLSSESALSFISKSKRKSDVSKAKRTSFDLSDAVGLSNADLERTLEQLGIFWASSTLKKTKETLAYSTSTSSSQTSVPKGRHIRRSNKSLRKSDVTRPDATCPKEKKSVDLQTSQTKYSPVKEFIIKELADKITFSNEDSQTEFMSLYSTKLDPESVNADKHTPHRDLETSKSKLRTSTPVPLFKSGTFNQSSTSSNIFSNLDDLSSVKGSTDSKNNTEGRDELVLPNCSLRTKKLITSDLSSDV